MVRRIAFRKCSTVVRSFRLRHVCAWEQGACVSAWGMISSPGRYMRKQLTVWFSFLRRSLHEAVGSPQLGAFPICVGVFLGEPLPAHWRINGPPPHRIRSSRTCTGQRKPRLRASLSLDPVISHDAAGTCLWRSLRPIASMSFFLRRDFIRQRSSGPGPQVVRLALHDPTSRRRTDLCGCQCAAHPEEIYASETNSSASRRNSEVDTEPRIRS